MLHALLHGKLAATLPEPDRLEDALTSSVFGTLIMVGAWDVLGRWLAPSESAISTHPLQDCWFWPRLPGGVEPDVLLRLGSTLVAVEAKYRSGRHDVDTGEGVDERPADQILRQRIALSTPPDQRDAYPDALEHAVDACAVHQAFVVDARRIRRARREHAESVALLPVGAVLRLVTWQDLFSLLLLSPDSGERWNIDLRLYLQSCGLEAFAGVPRDLASEEDGTSLLTWRPFAQPEPQPAIRDGIGVLAEPLIASLRSWRLAAPLQNEGTR